MSEDRARRLALLLQAMDDANQELAEYKAEHKARMETLSKELSRLRYEIITGQSELPLEAVSPIPDQEIPGTGRVVISEA